MLKLWHAPRTRSSRVLWLIGELGLDHTVERIEFKPEVIKAPGFLKVHPLGKLPALEDDGQVLTESIAIMMHLLEAHGGGRLQPAPGSPDRAAFLHWMVFSEASLMEPVLEVLRHTMLRPEERRVPMIAEEGRVKIVPALGMLEAALDGRDHLLGDYSAADVAVGYTLTLANLVGLIGPDTPRVAAYLARLSGRPAYTAAFA